MQQLPGGIRCIPLQLETRRFDAKGSQITDVAIIAFENGSRSWNNVGRTIKKNIDTETIVCLQTENIIFQDLNKKKSKKRSTEKEDVKNALVWACFTNKAARNRAIVHSLNPKVSFTVLPILEKTDIYYVYVIDYFPMYPEESATRWIMAAFKFCPVQKNQSWFLYFGRTDPPLEIYNGTATIITRRDVFKDRTFFVYDRPVRAHGSYYLFCPQCKILNDHEPSTCPI